MRTLKSPKLTDLVAKTDSDCSRCGRCSMRCAFLRKHGTPGEIARKMRLKSHELWADPFECSLCGLCGAVCSEGLKPDTLFLEMRRAKIAAGGINLKRYSPVLSYEKRGDSDLFSLIRLPDGGDTVFFPGCAMSATRSNTVRSVFQALQAIAPDVGIALGCCLKPSHDLGRQEFFEQRFGRLHEKLRHAGVKRVLTTCSNCQKIFNEYGGLIEAVTVYEFLVDSGFVPTNQGIGKAVILDPCPQRYEVGIQDAVRTLARSCGVVIEELDDRGELTRCCGEGGMVKFVRPEFAEIWKNERLQSVAGRRMVTSCAGCAHIFGGSGEVDHILDLMFNAKSQTRHNPLFAYIARYRLKRWFMKRLR